MAYTSEIVQGNLVEISKYLAQKLNAEIPVQESYRDLAAKLESFLTKRELGIVSRDKQRKYLNLDRLEPLFALATHKPTKEPVATGIILEAEYLNATSQNKLLKLLEEPPQFLQIILCCNDANTLLTTVKSRCQLTILSAKKPQSTAESESVASALVRGEDNSYKKLKDYLASAKDSESRLKLLSALVSKLTVQAEKTLETEIKEGRPGAKSERMSEIIGSISQGIRYNANAKLLEDFIYTAFRNLSRR